MVEWCAHENIQLITWTVNEEKDIRKMIELGVTEIISDYPERVLRLSPEKNNIDEVIASRSESITYFLQ
jgi:glycerophosphoryl diester phosphodiesterase